MPRDSHPLNIPIAATTRGTIFRIPVTARGVTHVHLGGKWATGEDFKVQYATDKRTSEDDVWHDAAGGAITGITGTWVMRTENIPEEAIFVAIYSTHVITPDATYPPIANLIYDEGPLG